MPEEPKTNSLKELDAKLRAARENGDAVGQKGTKSKPVADGSLSVALKTGVEFVSAVAVGVAIGLLLDHWLQTKPWLMIVFFLLGSAAGFLNIFRSVGGYGYAAGYDAKTAETNEKDEGSD